MNNLVILNCADILAKNTEQSPLILGNSSYMYISLQFVPDISHILIALGNFCFGFMNVCVFMTVQLPGPEVMKLFSCSTQLSLKFILIINVKMPTTVGILTFYEQDKLLIFEF